MPTNVNQVICLINNLFPSANRKFFYIICSRGPLEFMELILPDCKGVYVWVNV